MALIEREAVTAALTTEGITKNMRVHKLVLSAPTIDAAPVVHGRWDNDRTEEGRIIGYFCSVCGTSLDSHPRMHYCPNCGARMDEGEDDG